MQYMARKLRERGFLQQFFLFRHVLIIPLYLFSRERERVERVFIPVPICSCSIEHRDQEKTQFEAVDLS